ncbi:MAG: S46 family peptidase [Bacteroidia bacterium]|nr:S46 family peptidase [Bacteroidia bacterium]
MKKILIIIAGFILTLNISVKADEGMWLLSLIGKNYEKMKAMGLRLTPDDIYNINKACLKDAIVGLSNVTYLQQGQGFFCTGEIISDQALVLTNHHCSYDVIQKHSAIEHDYLKNGFWAATKDQELTNEDLTASILVRMEDVTARILGELKPEMTESDRNSKINKIKKEIENEAKKGTGYDAFVKPMFDGNQFFLFVYETFTDVRIVGAPPSSIGKFGGDTDNWMWPRHTGDFSVMRIYMSKEGKPAKYSKDNVPYKPRHYLPVSIKGVKKDDYTMILGFPGSTQRFMPSWGVEETVERSNPIRIKVRTAKLDILRKDMASDDKIRIKYASKYAQSSNYWKYSIGQNKGLKRLGVFEQKKTLEEKFEKWMNASESRKETYGEVFDLIEKAYNTKKQNSIAFDYMMESMFQGAEISLFPFQLNVLAGSLKNTPDKKDIITGLVEDLKKVSAEYFKDYNTETDKKVFATMLKIYYKDVPKEFHFSAIQEIEKKYKGDIDKFTDKLFEKSFFTDEKKFNEFLADPSYKAIEKDPAYKFTQSLIDKFIEVQRKANSSTELNKGMRLFVAGLMEMEKDKTFYPNANATLRITYGKVSDYFPTDAVYYNYFTTLKGVIEKEDPKVDEFIVPAKLKELYEKKDYGRYADRDGAIHVCFTSNNDITGGNSGSPVINGDGELVGTAFDGNWEAMSGDIKFETDLQKTIVCDIRYVLFIMDKFAGAKNLIDEMKIVGGQ